MGDPTEDRFPVLRSLGIGLPMGRPIKRAEYCGAPSSTAFSTRRSLPVLWTASNLAANLRIPRRISIGRQALSEPRA